MINETNEFIAVNLLKKKSLGTDSFTQNKFYQTFNEEIKSTVHMFSHKVEEEGTVSK